MNRTETRIAWVTPMSGLAFYLQPVLRELTRLFPETTLFTGEWPGYVPGCEEAFRVQMVGKSRFIKLRRLKAGYDQGFHWLSLGIIRHLLQFKPQVIFVTGLSVWTLLILLLKLWMQWRVILVYSGSSPTVDMSGSGWRSHLRRWMSRGFDAAITNSQAGKQYLTEGLGMLPQRMFARPYQMPDPAALLECLETGLNLAELPSPRFLFIGQTIHRKGITALLQACTMLKDQGIQNYSVVIIGDGEQRHELEMLTQQQGLQDCVKWVGWVQYGGLGSYFQQTDVFVFPTLEDIWGMVVFEAMLFSKPVLCSCWAGIQELLVPNESGYVFDPYHPEQLATYMKEMIEHPERWAAMGARSHQAVAEYSPPEAAQHLTRIIEFVQGNPQDSIQPTVSLSQSFNER